VRACVRAFDSRMEYIVTKLFLSTLYLDLSDCVHP